MLLLRSLALALPGQDAPNTAVQPTSPGATSTTPDFATRLAESGNVYRQFTCQIENIDVTCPGVKALAALNAQEALLKVPANEKWLFYGPSYMLQLFQTIVTANRAEIVEEISISEEYSEFKKMVRPRPPHLTHWPCVPSQNTPPLPLHPTVAYPPALLTIMPCESRRRKTLSILASRAGGPTPPLTCFRGRRLPATRSAIAPTSTANAKLIL